MKKLLALIFSSICLMSLVSCQNKPNPPKNLDVDSVVMLYENSNDLSANVRVTITDKDVIAELLSMHNDLRTEDSKQAVGKEKVWVIFREDEKHIIEWWIATDGKDWSDALFTTHSTAMTVDYQPQLVNNTRNYSRIIEILEQLKDK